MQWALRGVLKPRVLPGYGGQSIRDCQSDICTASITETMDT
jgi:hypothetical protein